MEITVEVPGIEPTSASLVGNECLWPLSYHTQTLLDSGFKLFKAVKKKKKSTEG